MYRYLILAVIAGIAGGIIARVKGYNQVLWVILCTVIPLLVFVILILPFKVYVGQIKRCPNCTAVVKEGEIYCRHCGNKLDASV
jgi:hypothetical protein